MNLSERLTGVLAEMEAASERGGRALRTVTLVAVTKTQPVEVLREFTELAAAHGIPAVFGENYLQEIKRKRAALGPQAEIHLIGPLQSNKVRDAVGVCQVIQSVHSLKVLELIAKEAARSAKRQRIYLQVNISADPQKSGFRVEELPVVIEVVRGLSAAIQLEGLMTITALYDNCEEARPDFRQMRELRETLLMQGYGDTFHDTKLRLSMGMSADFAVAIEEGADLIRVGTALFGDRL